MYFISTLSLAPLPYINHVTGEPPERLFVDFCTIAKISVIVLDEKYHGYYVSYALCSAMQLECDGNAFHL